jgi:hypothetical protein
MPWRVEGAVLQRVQGPAPDYLVKQIPRLKDAKGLQRGSLFGEIEFSAEPMPGFEVVDVLTNAAESV